MYYEKCICHRYSKIHWNDNIKNTFDNPSQAWRVIIQ